MFLAVKEIVQVAKPQLNRESIVATAIQLADDHGLDTVSLRGVAKQLGVHVTSLYNYFPTKEAVLEGMMQTLLAEATLPQGKTTWQDWVRNYALAIRGLAHKHPGAFQLFQRNSAQGEAALESFESAVAAFRAGGFDLQSIFCAMRTTNLLVLGLVIDDLARYRYGEDQTRLDDLPIERFPHINELRNIDDEVDPFPYLLNVLIEGLAANRQS
jgi:AcrR family transcriptional regulator